MKFSDSVLPIAVIVVVALGAYFVLGDKMIDRDIDTNVQAANPLEVLSQQVDESMTEEPMMDDDSEEQEESSNDETQARDEEVSTTATDEVTKDLVYNNGTYTANTSYSLPNGGSHDMEVSITISDDVVTAIGIVYDGDRSGGSTSSQQRFNDAIDPLVIGQQVDNISLSRVGGSSLTTNGFNDALNSVKNQARS